MGIFRHLLSNDLKHWFILLSVLYYLYLFQSLLGVGKIFGLVKVKLGLEKEEVVPWCNRSRKVERKGVETSESQSEVTGMNKDKQNLFQNYLRRITHHYSI